MTKFDKLMLLLAAVNLVLSLLAIIAFSSPICTR